MRGSNNHAWKGGVMTLHPRGNHQGYRYVRCPPEFQAMAWASGYVGEHRLIAAMAIGRCLTSTEVVHHMNHDPHDNRLLNLALFKTNADHKRFEAHREPRPVWLGLTALITTG